MSIRNAWAVLLWAGLLSVLAPPTAVESAPTAGAYGPPRRHFEKNVGQVDPRVRFLSRGSGYTMYLTERESVVSLHSAAGKKHGAGVLRMRLHGSREMRELHGREPLSAKVHYLRGRDISRWHRNVPVYRRVELAGVYPGIDLVYYGTGRELEYDFVLEPGADPRGIEFELDGADSIEISDGGDLVLKLTEGEVRLRRPRSYQEIDAQRRTVESRYELREDGRVGFELGRFDATRRLVIDPVLVYSTYLGGDDQDEGFGIVADASGHAYVTGSIFSEDFPTARALQPMRGVGGRDAFVSKLTPDGQELVYSTYLGGSSFDIGQTVAVNDAGNVFVAGSTGSDDFPLVDPIDTTRANVEGFVSKLSADGSELVFSTYFGGSGVDDVRAIDVDLSGDAYLTGSTVSADFPLVHPLDDEREGTEAYVAKLRFDGQEILYSTFLGGSSSDSGEDVSVDDSGQAHVIGLTFSEDFPVLHAFQPELGGSQDAFVAKLSFDGRSLRFSTYLGGEEFDVGNGIDLDCGGNVYVAGFTNSEDFPLENPLQTEFARSDAFVTKLKFNGQALLYSTYLGGERGDQALDVTVDIGGNAYVTGLTNSDDFPMHEAIQPLRGGVDFITDAFVSALNFNGSAFLYSTYLGGSGNDMGNGIAVYRRCTADQTCKAIFPASSRPARSVYVTGATESVDFPAEAAIQSDFGGEEDVFVVRIDDVPPVGGSQQGASATPADTPWAHASLPLHFETNRGQAPPSAGFVARGRGYGVTLSPREIGVALVSPSRSTPSSVSFLHLELRGADGEARMEGRAELAGRANYFIGDDPGRWLRDLPTYAEVRVADVYPGIDVLYYGRGGELEWDFVVTPGVDPRMIHFAVEGADRIDRDADGDLVLQLAGGRVRLRRPVVYQEIDGVRREIDASYRAYGSSESPQLGFALADYDRGRPLIIDPVLSYSTYLGGSNSTDESCDIAVDTTGHAFVTGRTFSSNFPTRGPPQTGPAQEWPGDFDFNAFVTKLAPDGSGFVYSTYLGGSNSSDAGYAIALDGDGHAYVTGRTFSSNFPTRGPPQTGPAQEWPGDVDFNAFVTKLAPDGSELLYSTYLGGSNSSDEGFGIQVDESGYAYVTGRTFSSNFPTLGPPQTGPAQEWPGDFDFNAFVTKLTPDGSAFVYSTYLGGSNSSDEGFDLALAADGSAYVTGRTFSSDFPTLGPPQTGPAQEWPGDFDFNAFVTKLAPDGSEFLYSTYLGGSNSTDEGLGIAVDATGHAYVTGRTFSSNFPTLGPPQTGPAQEWPGDFDFNAFVTKLLPDGSAFVYSTYLGGSNSSDAGFDLALAADGSVYVTGRTFSSNFPTIDPVQEWPGDFDFNAFFTVLNPEGDAFTHSTYLGGANSTDEAYGIALGPGGEVFLTGRTFSSDFPTLGPPQTGPAQEWPGDFDFNAFVAKLVVPEPSGDLGMLAGLVALALCAQRRRRRPIR